MSITYSHVVRYSQANFEYIHGNKSRNIRAGKQYSYNIPKVMFYELKRFGIIDFYDADEQGEDYYLVDKIELVLSDNIISLIGQHYKNKKNEFFIRHAFSNGKAQLIRKAYHEKGTTHQWFVDLYDNNIIGSTMLYIYDKVNNRFIIDVVFPNQQ